MKEMALSKFQEIQITHQALYTDKEVIEETIANE